MRPGRKGPGYVHFSERGLAAWKAFNEAGAQRPRILQKRLELWRQIQQPSMRPGRKGPGYINRLLINIPPRHSLQ